MITTEEEAKAFVAERCSAEQLVQLQKFAKALVSENKRQNLIAKGTVDHLWQRHIADSAQLLDYVPRGTSTWLDLGTGAGFPGLVIAIMRPEFRLYLVESRRKRIDWLHGVVADLRLANCTILGSRLELVDVFEADIISARAFAPLPKLLDLSLRFSTKRTVWLLPKGRSAAQEVGELRRSTNFMFHVEQSVTSQEAGIIVGRARNEDVDL